VQLTRTKLRRAFAFDQGERALDERRPLVSRERRGEALDVAI
jgi:hypothetical protein